MSDRFSSPPGISRNAVIAGSVVLFHIAALWALQTGLIRRAAEVVVPVEILSQFVDPPTPIEPPPPPPAAPPPPEPPKQVTPPAPAPKPRPLPVKVAKPSPQAPVAAPEPPPAPPAPPAPPPPAPPAPPAPSVQLPSTNADYAKSCGPVYPAISKRLGEQGRVVVKVLVSADGQPQKVDIRTSSGFERLDEAARDAMLRCRFVPGKVNGVAQSMAYDAPINFVLK